MTSALEGGEWSASHSDRFSPCEGVPSTQFIGGWVGRRAGGEADLALRKLSSPFQESNLGRPAGSPMQ
jgi:hypothetical protein